jgi:galactitol PTS system EIIA component
LSENLVEVSDYLRDQLIFLHTSFKTSKELFTAINAKAQENGFVTDQFLPKIIKREATFPTGLQLEHRVWLSHILTQIRSTKNLLPWLLMMIQSHLVGWMTQNKRFAAKLVFVLGLNKPHAQLDMLQALMSIIQDDELVNSLENADNANQIHQLLSR